MFFLLHLNACKNFFLQKTQQNVFKIKKLPTFAEYLNELNI
jgi:hypothetical protein